MPLVRWPQLCLILAAVAAAAPGARAEAEPPAPPAEVKQFPPGFPSAALAAAAKNWNVARAEERALQPGAAGQIDLFWEILALLEKDEKGEKARKDKDLEAVLEWLLFGARLWQNPELREPVYVKVPACSPRLGARLLDERLMTWITQSAGRLGGSEPWAWPEYQAMDRKEFAAAVKRLMEKGPKHNPVTRLWMAAALLASDDAEGAKVFQEASGNLAKNLPSQADALADQVVKSLADAGVSGALGPLLDLADKEADGGTSTANERAYTSYRNRDALARFYRLMNWILPADVKPDTKAQVAEARTWLAANAGKLKWDPQRRGYASDVPPPGQETLYKYGAAVEKKYGVKVFENLGARRHTDLLGDLTALMESKPEAAADKDVEELYCEILEPYAPSAAYGNLKGLVFDRAVKANRNLGARVWAMNLRHVLRNLDLNTDKVDPCCAALDVILRGERDVDEVLRDQGFAMVLPEFRKRYDEAKEGKDEARFADAAFAYLRVGGTLEAADLKALFERLPESWSSGKYGSKFFSNVDQLQMLGRIGVLRLLLLAAEKEAADQRSTYTATYRFANSTGWVLPGASLVKSPELAAQYAKWFEKHEKSLRWDPKRKRFAGAPLEDDSPLLHVADAVCGRYELELPDTRSTSEWYRKVVDDMLALAAKKKEALEDPLVQRLLFGAADAGNLWRDKVHGRKLLVSQPAENRDLGLALWTHYLDSQLDELVAQAHSNALYQLSRLDENAPGYDPKLVGEARTKLLAKYKDKYGQVGDAPVEQRVGLMLCCLYLGADAEAMGLDKLGEDARRQGDTQLSRLYNAAEYLAKIGCPGSLRAYLVVAKFYPNMRSTSLRNFERCLWPNEEQVATWNRRTAESDIDAQLKWLSEHQKDITWDADARRFQVPAEAGRPGDSAPKPAPAVPDPGDAANPVVPPKPADYEGF